MVYLGLRVPRSVLDKLTKRAKRESDRIGVSIHRSAIARSILEQHA
jgi:hypothetical protein